MNFIVAFPGLLGRADQPTTAQMQAFTDFQLQVQLPPNPVRALDNSLNAAQQAAFDQLKKRLPGIQTFTEDRDRLIKLYANGSVAVASFYRYTTTILPPTTPPEVAKEFGPGAATITLVLEKRDGDWKIVHTHVSDLGPPANQTPD